MIRVSIIGASGYTGGELIKLLTRHPRVSISWVTSENHAHKKVSDVHLFLKGRFEHVLRKLDIDKLIKESDVIFSCLPHGEIIEYADKILHAKKKLIDLSADFRIKDPATYKTWYKLEHTKPELLAKACYGLPELNRENIAKAHLIANPGCYATASILALAPILASKHAIPNSVIIDAKSGVSGAGRKLDLSYHFAEANENLTAYKVAEHRHTPEIEQELSLQSSQDVKITFVPHLIPIDRGILVTCYTHLHKNFKPEEIYELYREFYKDESFMHILPLGEFPQIKSVVNTNNCWIGLKLVEKTKELIVIGVIDNLMKGASGQAVQNFNICCGIPETTALL